MFSRRLILGALGASLALPARVARATVYFTSTSIRKKLFPGATSFRDRSVALTKAQRKQIAKASKTRVNFSRFVAFDAYGPKGRQGTLIIDKVYGKHEFITYAVALDTTGAVIGIEIMDFRESYGDEVRNAKWRAQFRGRKAGEPLKIDKQVRNISGATLSCVHITDGVRRVLATHALLRD